jgi:hypothetical protein
MTVQALTGNQSRSEEREADSSRSASITSASNEDEATLRLERELAIVLGRRPRHQDQNDSASGDDELPLQDAQAVAGQSGDVAQPADNVGTTETAGAEPEPTAAGQSEGGRQPQPGITTRERWLRSLKRASRLKLMGVAASFAITLLVIAFILALVAVFLFGLPTGMGGNRSASGDKPAGRIEEAAKKTEPAPVAARSSWIYQGR